MLIWFKMIDIRANLKTVHRALLVGVHLGKDSSETTSSLLQELKELTHTLGLAVVESLPIKIQDWHATYLLGSGKAQEISDLARQKKADVIIFDNELSPAQQRNWEKLSEKAVIDREEVILEIFARRARTREARLQIGLAYMEYSLPRLTRAWGHLGRQAGGIGGRGEGETQLETDRRIVSRRIERFRAELEEVRSQRSTQRKQRLRRPTPVAAIVGYTNAGKSSLLKKLTGAEVLVEDKLFATLDTTTRKIELPNGQPLLLTDTVGFVRKLPHRLVESFKATLEEAVMSDFLIHVLDASNPEIFECHETTLSVLKELGADQKPTLTVLNKMDLSPDPTQLAVIRQHFPNALYISTKTGEGLNELLERMAELLNPELMQVKVAIPQSRYSLFSQLHRLGQVLEEEFKEDTIHAVARIPKKYHSLYSPFMNHKNGNSKN